MNVDNCTIMQVSLRDTIGLSLLIQGIPFLREQSLSLTRTGAEGNQQGYEIC